ncbi:MAG: response regulator [Acidobacteriota bacterium]
MTQGPILLIEESESEARLIQDFLADAVGPGVESEWVATVQRATEILRSRTFKTILLDLDRSGSRGVNGLRALRETAPKIPVIALATQDRDGLSELALREGAQDFLVKSEVDSIALARSLRYASERKRVEEALVADEEQNRALEKQEAIERLAAGLAHDLNNMLSVVLGTTDLALGRDESEPLRPQLEQIRAAGERARGLVRQLETLSGHPTLSPKVVDLAALLREAEPKMKRLLGSMPLEMRVGSNEVLVDIDPNHFETVLLNLVTNAREAMPQGGRVTLSLTTNSEQARIDVTDLGTGIAPEIMGLILDPFFTTKPHRPAGLGLSSAASIVRGSGGNLDIHSQVGRGTTVSIDLPTLRDRPEEIEAPKAPAASAGQKAATILVVDDERLVLDMASEVLEGAGYEVIAVDRPLKALEMFRSNPTLADLVLTDITMPELDGRDLVDLLAQEQPTLRYIYMSGFGQLRDDQPVLRGPTVVKPFDLRELVDVVRRSLAV